MARNYPKNSGYHSWARFPDAEVVRGGDEGQPVATHRPDDPAAREFHRITDQLTKLLPPAEDETCTARLSVLEDMLAELDAQKI